MIKFLLFWIFIFLGASCVNYKNVILERSSGTISDSSTTAPKIDLSAIADEIKEAQK